MRWSGRATGTLAGTGCRHRLALKRDPQEIRCRDSTIRNCPSRYCSSIRPPLYLQLSAGRNCTIAGRHADPSDHDRSLWRTGPRGLPPQRRLHLPAPLRPLPEVRFRSAHPARGLSPQPQPAPRLADGMKDSSPANVRLVSSASTTTSTCATRAPRHAGGGMDRTATSSMRTSCCRAASIRVSSNSPKQACCAWSASSTSSPTDSPRCSHLHEPDIAGSAYGPTTSSGNLAQSRAPGTSLPLPWILDRRKPEDGLQSQVQADRGAHRWGMAAPAGCLIPVAALHTAVIFYCAISIFCHTRRLA